MKAHPATEVEQRVDDGKVVDEQVNELVLKVKADQERMRNWLDKQAFYRWITYGAGDPGRRGVDAPWVGASDLFMPLPEVYCNQVVAPYMNMLHGGTRHVRMVPLNADGWANRVSAEMVMEAWAKGGGKHFQSDLRRQTAYMLYNLAYTGRGIMHARYSYVTRVESTTLSRNRLPGILAKLVIVPSIDANERINMMHSFPQINSPDVLQFYGVQEPVQPLDRKLFQQFAPRIEAAVIRLFGLDKDDPTDQVALSDIMGYFKAGTPDRKFTVRMRAVVEDGPRLESVAPNDLIVPEGTLCDFSRAQRLTQRLHMTRSEAAGMAKDSEWVNMDEAMETADAAPLMDDQMRTEQLWRTMNQTDASINERDDLIELWKVWSYEPLTPAVSEAQKDKLWKNPSLRQLICTIVEPNSSVVLYRAVVEGDLPYTCFTLEAKDGDYYDSRGIAEMLRDVTSHVNALYRGFENVITLTTFPVYQAKRSAFTDPEGFEIAPGDVLIVDNPGDIQQFPLNGNVLPMEKLIGALMQWPERLIGGIDHQLTNQDQPSERPRTATEMGMIDNARQRILGVRGLIALEDYAKALQQVWNLIVKYGPDEMTLSVTGQPPMRLSQAQIRGDYSVRPVASVGDMDPSTRFQKAMARFQLMMQSRPVLDSDPTRAPQYVRALMEAFDADDPLATQVLLPPRPQQEVQQIMQMKQQQAQQTQQMQQIADQLDANIPTDPEEALKLLKQLKSIAPYPEMQRWRQMAAAQQADYQASRDAVNGAAT